jgi:hypothetical protein
MKKYLRAIALMGGICALALAAAATPASAGVAFLSHTGGGSMCTQAAPCNTMSSAISVAGANGEVICLDKGSYGATSIAQSVTISCGDGLWEDSSGSVVINPPAGSDVVIEGLVLDGNGAVGVGIAMGNQGTLHLRRVRVGNNSGNGSHGLVFASVGPATLHITDSVFYNNGGSGVLIIPQSGGWANVHIRNSRFEHNLHGLFADGTASNVGINVNIAESAAVDNKGDGIGAYTGTAPVTVSVVASQITGNITNGIGVFGTGGAPVAVKIGNSQITGNVNGLAVGGTGQILTVGGNQLHSNLSNGSFTGSIAPQ